MDAQRDGDLHEINADQSVSTIEGGAHVDYEYIGCVDDCHDIPTAITSFAFEIVFNGVECDCPAGDNHDRACSYYEPGSSGRITIIAQREQSEKATRLTYKVDNADEGCDVIDDLAAILASNEAKLDGVIEKLSTDYGWYASVNPSVATNG
jgi:hypothetical protein